MGVGPMLHEHRRDVMLRGNDGDQMRRLEWRFKDDDTTCAGAITCSLQLKCGRWENGAVKMRQ